MDGCAGVSLLTFVFFNFSHSFSLTHVKINRFDTVSHIIDSWEAVRRINDYDEVAGVLLFKKFFKLEPSAKKIFHFNGSSSRSKGSKGCYDNDDEDELLFYQSPKLIRHAKYFIQMIDKALQLLGPDSELLTTMLKELGQKHVKFGVTSHITCIHPWEKP